MGKKTTKKTARPLLKPYPCSTPGCAGVLVPRNNRGEAIDMEREGASRWTCSRGGGPGCGFTVEAKSATGAERCPADGAPVRFDANMIGQTCGGLTLRGWNICDHCGGVFVTRRGIPHAGGDSSGAWSLSAGGRSLNAGSVRLRAEAGPSSDEIRMVMARASRMPGFERALAAIAHDGITPERMRELALEALSIGDNISAVEQ
jgi:hypothetical protein